MRALLICLGAAALLVCGCASTTDDTASLDESADYLSNPARSFSADFKRVEGSNGQEYIAGTATGKGGVTVRFCYVPDPDHGFVLPRGCKRLPSQSACSGIAVAHDGWRDSDPDVNRGPVQVRHEMGYELDAVYVVKAPDAVCEG
jgi:hypothetical protein